MALLANLLLVVLALVMAFRLGRKYLDQSRPSTLAYAVGFKLIAFAAFLDLYAHLSGAWPAPLYLLYWVTVATLVPVMGAGTIYLFHRTAGHLFLGLTLLAGLAMVVRAFGLPVDPSVLVPGEIGSLKPLPELQPFTKNLPRLGALVILAGALWTWAKTRRNAMLWIALGTVLFTLAGMLAVRIGSTGFYALQTLAIVSFYAGVVPRSEPVTAQARSVASE
jgi:hypothetical protein